MTLDIRDFSLQSFLEEPEFLRIHGKYFLEDIRSKYDISSMIAQDGYVYCKVQRGLYGLKQAAKLARNQLVKHLAKFGYHPSPHAPNIWFHDTKPTKFCLCVDDFGIKYFTKEDSENLINALKEAYEITIDRDGTNFCGLHLQWNYKEGYVDVSMPKYVQKVLDKLNHPAPKVPQNSPHKWVPITYNKQPHMAQEEDNTDILPTPEIKYIQQVIGSFLYYARAVDNTTFPAINQIASNQA